MIDNNFESLSDFLHLYLIGLNALSKAYIADLRLEMVLG